MREHYNHSMTTEKIKAQLRDSQKRLRDARKMEGWEATSVPQLSPAAAKARAWIKEHSANKTSASAIEAALISHAKSLGFNGD